MDRVGCRHDEDVGPVAGCQERLDGLEDGGNPLLGGERSCPFDGPPDTGRHLDAGKRAEGGEVCISCPEPCSQDGDLHGTLV